MASSGYWKIEMDKIAGDMEKKLKEVTNFEELEGQLSSIPGMFEPLIEKMNTTGEYLTKVVVYGKSFDDGKLAENASTLSQVKGKFETLQTECQKKLEKLKKEYQELDGKYRTAETNYKTALAAEERARQEALWWASQQKHITDRSGNSNSQRMSGMTR